MKRVAYEKSVPPSLGLGGPKGEDLKAHPMFENRAKILIADDSATNRLVLKRVLADVAAEVVETRSGVEAVAAARDNDFALILLDVQMPGLDGFEAIRQLREMPRLAATPIMLMSAALTEPSHSKLGYEVGAVDYLVNKPVDPEMLRQKVRVFLDLYRSRMELLQLAALARDENQRLNQENEQFRASREELVHRATHDALTGLPNRVLFEDRLQSAIQRSARSRSSFAVAYFDLDRFKSINDRFGHAAGDALLSEIARRMVGNLRGSDTVARLSGDEFVMLLEGMDGSPRAELTGRKILQILRQPINLSATSIGPQGSVEPSASVGISMYPADAQDADGLLMLADLAMYRVKQSGGCGVRLYSSGVDSKNAPPDGAASPESVAPGTPDAPPPEGLG